MAAENVQVTEERGWGVLELAAGCVLAGAGAGVAVGIVAGVLTRDVLLSISAAAAVCGVLGGVLLFWTFARDPLRNAYQWEQLRLECDRLDDENETLADALDAMRMRAGAWEDDARTLRMQLNAKQNYVKPVAQDDPILQDALTLAELYFASGVSPTVREMQAQGWSQERFSVARRMLSSHGVINVSATRTRWLVDSREAVVSALCN